MNGWLAMPDSVTVAALPDGYPAYLGYADGHWPTETQLRARFPHAELVILTVTGNTSAHGIQVMAGIDTEPGNPGAPAAARWAAAQLDADPLSRPVIYADLETPGYSMNEVITELAALGIPTPGRPRLLSAHYGIGEHICNPLTCPVAAPMDGTQWTNDYPGTSGARIDMSALRADFFAPAAPVTQWIEFDMTRLPVLRQGDSDQPGGGFWYIHRLQVLLHLTGLLNGIDAAMALNADGQFGPLTDAAVRAVQGHYRITVDGKAGPQTWGVLLTGAPT